MSQTIRVSSEVYNRLGKYAEGFETPAQVIEKILNRIEGKNESVQQQSKKDYSKYSFNNNHRLGKGRLVLAVVKDYVSKHPSISFEQLLNTFEKKLQGSVGVVNELDFVINKYPKSKPCHFIKSEEIISLENCKVVVCTEWGVGNIDLFINQAMSLGYQISKST